MLVVVIMVVVVILVIIVMLVAMCCFGVGGGVSRGNFLHRGQGLNDRSNRSFGNTGLLCHWCRGRARVGSRGGLGGGQRTFFHAGHKGGHQLRQVRRGPSHSRGGGRCRHHWHALGHNLGRRSYHRGGGWRFRLVGGVGIGLAKGGGVIFGQEAGHIATVNSIDQG
jgi:hypothetical protein